MSYQVEVLPKAAESIRQLDPPVSYRILIRLKWLSVNMDGTQHRPLAAKFKGMYKLRVGDYRILYSVDHARKLLLVHRVGHRRDIYKLP